VNNQPFAIGFTVTSRPAQPPISLLAILQRSLHPVQTMAECHVIACSDAYIGKLDVNRILIVEDSLYRIEEPGDYHVNVRLSTKLRESDREEDEARTPPAQQLEG
jgi:hypothetical protein